MSRYPYTYACDYLRMETKDHGQLECKMSRSDASRIQSIIADALGMPDEDLAKALADRFIDKYGE